MDLADQHKLKFFQASVFEEYRSRTNHLKACLILSHEATNPSASTAERDDAKFLENQHYEIVCSRSTLDDVERAVIAALQKKREKGFESRLHEAISAIGLQDFLEAVFPSFFFFF